MKDMFAELMAFLFAENRRNNPMPATHINRLLANIKQLVCSGTDKAATQKEGEKDGQQEKFDRTGC